MSGAGGAERRAAGKEERCSAGIQRRATGREDGAHPGESDELPGEWKELARGGEGPGLYNRSIATTGEKRLRLRKQVYERTVNVR